LYFASSAAYLFLTSTGSPDSPGVIISLGFGGASLGFGGLNIYFAGVFFFD